MGDVSKLEWAEGAKWVVRLASVAREASGAGGLSPWSLVRERVDLSRWKRRRWCPLYVLELAIARQPRYYHYRQMQVEHPNEEAGSGPWKLRELG